MAKVHLRVNKLTETNSPIPACAAKIGSGDKVNRNQRTSRYTASECVGYADWSKLGEAACMLCAFEVERINNKRVKLGLKSWL